MKPTLFLTIGYPGAGKSFFSTKLADTLHLVRISSGMNGQGIRDFMFKNKLEGWPENNEIVYGAMRYAVSEVLRAQHSVIFDSSNSNVADRAKMHELAHSHGADSIIVWLTTPVEAAHERADSRDSGEEDAVPRSHFDKLVERFQAPTDEEKVVKIDGTLPFEEQLESFNTQLKAFGFIGYGIF